MAEYFDEAVNVEEPVMDLEETNEVVEPEVIDPIPEEENEEVVKVIDLDQEDVHEDEGINWPMAVAEVGVGFVAIWLIREFCKRRAIKKNAGKPKHKRKKKKMIRRKKNYVEIRIPTRRRRHHRNKKHYESNEPEKENEVIDAEFENKEQNEE